MMRILWRSERTGIARPQLVARARACLARGWRFREAKRLRPEQGMPSSGRCRSPAPRRRGHRALAARLDQRGEDPEPRPRVVRPGTCLWVVLARQHRKLAMHHALERAVVGAEVGQLELG